MKVLKRINTNAISALQYNENNEPTRQINSTIKI